MRRMFITPDTTDRKSLSYRLLWLPKDVVIGFNPTICNECHDSSLYLEMRECLLLFDTVRESVGFERGRKIELLLSEQVYKCVKINSRFRGHDLFAIYIIIIGERFVGIVLWVTKY